jgi:hypothetical protein
VDGIDFIVFDRYSHSQHSGNPCAGEMILVDRLGNETCMFQIPLE